MSAADSFQHLIRQFETGNTDDAARAVTHRFTARLVGLAKQKLDSRIQHKEDAEEAVQSAFGSFFAKREAGQFQVSDWDELWSLLAVVTVRKCLRRVERWQAQKRRAELAALGGGDDARLDVISREPTPEEAAVLVETFESLVSPLSDRERLMVDLRLQGLPDEQIAQRAERSVYTVQMVLRRVERNLRKMLVE